MSQQTAAITIPNRPSEAAFWLAALAVHESQAVQSGQTLARLESQDEQAPPIELSSPIDGYVVGLHVTAGQMVPAGEILCYICEHPSLPAAKAGSKIVLPKPTSFDPSALIIFGGGGHGKILIDLIRAAGIYRIVGIIDDGLPAGSEVLDVPVLGGAKDLEEWRDRGIGLAANGVGGIGNVGVRLKIFDLLSKAGYAFPILLHPSAVVERSATLEAGVQILAMAYVGGAVRIGFGSILNAGVIVSHDSVLGRVVNLSPGATLAGKVYVEDHAQIGMRATVNVGITVGAGALLGNGCTVKADVPPATRVRAGTIWPIPSPRPTA